MVNILHFRTCKVTDAIKAPASHFRASVMSLLLIARNRKVKAFLCLNWCTMHTRFCEFSHLIKKLKAGKRITQHSNAYCCLFYERRAAKNRLFAMFRDQNAEIYSAKAQDVSKHSCKTTPRTVAQTLDSVRGLHGKQMR
jgi:hypothetical protein